jgi:catechol 2,3-dioxygenase-like lactoylglutathione lyase family enzyme
MFIGAHFLLYSNDAEADRAFFRDVLGFQHVDAGHGWLIFGLPPAEAAIHPTEQGQENAPARPQGASLYLMCEDLEAVMAALKKKKVQCAKVEKARWGNITTIPLPSGGGIGLYQPSHPTALNLKSNRPKHS